MSGEQRIESSSCAAVNPLLKIVFPLKKLVRYCPSPDIGLCVGGNSFFFFGNDILVCPRGEAVSFAVLTGR